MKARNLLVGTLLGAVALGGFAAPAFANAENSGNGYPCHTEQCKHQNQGNGHQNQGGNQQGQGGGQDQGGNGNGNHNGNGNGNHNGNGNGNVYGDGNKYQNVNGSGNTLYMDSFNNRHFHSFNQSCVDCGLVSNDDAEATSTAKEASGKGGSSDKADSQVSVKPVGSAATGGGFTATR